MQDAAGGTFAQAARLPTIPPGIPSRANDEQSMFIHIFHPRVVDHSR
jgi:hypothetical protein